MIIFEDLEYPNYILTWSNVLSIVPSSGLSLTKGQCSKHQTILSVLAVHRPFYILICISTLPTQHTMFIYLHTCTYNIIIFYLFREWKKLEFMDIEVAVRVIYYLGETIPVRRTIFVVLLLSCVYLHSSLTIFVVHQIVKWIN